MKKLIILLVLIGLVNVVWAEGPPVEWEKNFGGSGLDQGRSVQQTEEGGYIIAGETSSYGAGSDDVWLIKTDADGNDIWNKTFGGSDNDYGYSVQQTTDEGYIVAGYTDSYGAGGYDLWLIKTDADGNDIWKKTFGGSDNDYGYSVQQTIDGGYIVTGYTYSFGAGSRDLWLIKTDADGNDIWKKTFGGSDWDGGYSVQQTTDGGYIVAGYTYCFGVDFSDAWLIKTDSDGNDIWNKTFGGSNFDFGQSVQQTADGGYILAGMTSSYGAGDYDVWLVKTDSDGNDIWTKTFGGSSLDHCWSAQQTTDGGYILTGRNDSHHDVWFIKTDAYGSEIWNKAIGGEGSCADYAYSVQQTADGGYISAGITSCYGVGGDVYLIKLSADCIDQPRSDLTGDCKVDFRDFAVMASEWLDCGQYDPNDCL